MWQFYALMAKDQIDERRDHAVDCRLDHQRPRAARRRRPQLPAVLRHPSRPSARTV